ncbi:hypothetical protein NQ318_000964 [Aromia moschata]|uniref:Uncharacterized protein n=1 Tax=Aromia moschata TaxID=1265417 RepID=A0AAV8ZGT2_9CUCU|nr:hypothetical protein NQ318_000964 [Aromia moschata]
MQSFRNIFMTIKSLLAEVSQLILSLVHILRKDSMMRSLMLQVLTDFVITKVRIRSTRSDKPLRIPYIACINIPIPSETKLVLLE